MKRETHFPPGGGDRALRRLGRLRRLAPGGDLLFVLNAESDTISAIDTASLEVVRTFVVASDTTDLAFAAAGDELFLSQPVSDAILVIDLDGNVRRRFESPPPWPAAPHRLALLAEPSRSDAGTR